MPLCDASTLPGAASCFSCKVPKGFRATLNVAYLASFTGYTGTPQGLLDQSNSWQKVTGDLILAAKVWIAASHSGYSTDPNSLMALAACYLSCIDNGNFGDVESYLYAVNAGNSTDPAGEFAAAAPYQLLRGSEWRAELWLLDNLDGMNDPDAAIRGAVCLLNCLTPGMLKAIYAYILCQGLGGNIIPPGSTYGPTSEFDIVILANTEYIITWGANDVSATLCGSNFLSTGVGTQTIFYSGSCTLLQLFGNAAGTTVTARVMPSQGRVPTPSDVSLTADAAGNVVVSWGTIPATNLISGTEVWTSSDGVVFSLAGTVAKPTTSLTAGAIPGSGTIYAKVRFYGSNPLNLHGNFSNTASLTSVTADWVHRVQVNGGAIPSNATIGSVDTFVRALQSASIDSLMISVAMFVPDNLIAAITPLYKTLGNDPWTNHSFVSGDLTISGLRGDGSAKYLDTGVLNSDLSQYDYGLSLYVSQPVTGVSTEMGATGAAGSSPNRLQFQTSAAGGNFNSWATDATGGISTDMTYFPGFLSASRSSSSAGAMYRGNSIAGFTAGTSSAGFSSTRTDSHSIFCFAENNNGTAGSLSAKRLSFAAIHRSLTSTQTQALYAAVHALRKALGGGYSWPSAADAVTAWAARVVANGGSAPSAATKTALQTFYQALSDGGLLSKMLTVNCMVPDSLTACLTPLICVSGLDPWTNSGIAAGNLNSSGLLGDGTHYLTPGVNPSINIDSVNVGVSLYVNSGNNLSQAEWGTSVAGACDFYVSFTGTCFWDCWNTAGGRISHANSAYTGFISANRTSAAASAVYTGASGPGFATLVSSTTEVSTGSVSGSTTTLFRNSAGNFSTKRINFAAFHAGLTSAEAQTLFNAVQALRVALGGGWI